MGIKKLENIYRPYFHMTYSRIIILAIVVDASAAIPN